MRRSRGLGDVYKRQAEIIEHQSTTVPGIIRRSLLRTDSWRSDLHLGEDTLFWIDVLSRARRVGYQPEPDFVYHKTRIDGRSSTTQKYEERELLSHLEVWETASDKLAELGLDYFALRGRVALQTALTAMCRYNAKGISRPSYERFRALLTAHPVVRRYRFDARIQTVLWSILDDDYDAFLRAIRTRLVIAGMDLKFIKGVIPELEKTYEVRIDRWTGHDAHDEQASLELLDWADVLFCEWMLGNAVWYSHHKRPHQRLVVRCHLFEIQRDYGFELDVDAVDRFICVSLPTMEDMLSRFGFPRSKVRVVPNFIDTEAYKRYDDPDKPFRLAMVGILPARKGFHRALQVLKELRNVDPRYTLTVMGKTPGEVHWVANDPAEARYYELCDRYIAEHNLESAVVYAGWVDTRGELGKYGVVLSMSDFESFHVGAAEAFAAGSVPLVLPWSGAEFIYPKEFVVQEFELTVRSIAEIAQGAETP